jgi:xeroderma pigmentosum group C-complementing protein
MTGWDYHSGWSHPVYDGFVVCDEHVETLMDAWQVSYFHILMSYLGD